MNVEVHMHDNDTPTTSENVRGRIAHIIVYGTEDENAYVDDPGEHRADQIIAIFREAMLSQAALEAAEAAAYWDESSDGEMEEMHDGEGAVKAALDVALGTPPTKP